MGNDDFLVIVDEKKKPTNAFGLTGDEEDEGEEGVVGTSQPRSQLFYVNVGLVFGIIMVLLGGVMYRYFPIAADFFNPYKRALASEPFTRSLDLVRSNAEIGSVLGSETSLKANRKTTYHWTILGQDDTAEIVLDITGSTGNTRVASEWSKFSGLWRMDKATYLDREGGSISIPIRSDGNPLSSSDIALWRAADPETKLGKAKRAVLEGKAMAAKRMFDEAIKEDGKSAEAYYWRGRAFEEIRNSTKAIDDYREAVKRDPEFLDVAARLRELGG